LENLLAYFPNLTKTQIEQFEKLQGLYSEWNEKINVISRKDISELYTRHVLHSLAIAKIFSFVPGSVIVDVGTGGGFPGIPLAIMFPECQFTLVDSIGKKIIVVSEVSKAIGLKNVKAVNDRLENIPVKADFIVNRAVSRMSNLLTWSENKLSKTNKNTFENGVISLKGGDLDEELDETGCPHQVWDIKDFFKEEFFDTKKVVYIPANL